MFFSRFRDLTDTVRLSLVDRGVLALRWGLDVARGYTRAADSQEGILETLINGAQIEHPDVALRYAESSLVAIRLMGEARAGLGPMGIGARLALSEAEFVDLRLMAERLRDKSMRKSAEEPHVVPTRIVRKASGS